MSIRFANRRFTPSLVGSVLVVVGVAIFMQLGVWQLRRADQKQALQSDYLAGQQTTVSLTAENVRQLPRYQHVRARGAYETARQILLDNMPSAQGRPGFRVLTPFQLDSGVRILVDRGWIPMGDRRPDSGPLHVDEQSRVVTGRLDQLPQPGLRLDDAAQGAGNEWPRVLSFPEQDTIERVLGHEVAPHILLLDASHPDGFAREWQANVRFGPERHIGYAVQWFAFALVAVIIYLILSLKRESSSNDSNE